MHASPRTHREAHGQEKLRSGHRRPTVAFWGRWFLANSLVSGVLGLVWLVLRSGPKPSRFAYPCQQAALSTATLAFGAPLVAALLAARRRAVVVLRAPAGMVLAAAGLLATIGLWGHFSLADAYQGPGLAPPPGYRAQVFNVTDCPLDPIGDRFVGLDNLIALMGREGLKFYQSFTSSPEAGPEGIVGSDDVVILKINYQWTERGGTNVDLLRGLVRRIVDHPDSFTGEVVICENAQFNPINGFDRSRNNAQNIADSPHDVVAYFQGLGYRVSHFDWTVTRNTLVTEYSAGNMTDGYIRYAYDGALGGRVSYPKFQTDYGTYVSSRYGLWNTSTSSYDRKGLKFINIPVLKSHSAAYGATASVKNYMGLVTGALSTNSHNAVGNGILGALLGDIQPADLNIIDCIWINANPYDGPWTSYGAATRRDELVAGVDPVAADIWTVKNILIPAFLANGYTPPWPFPSADPDNPSSEFRQYLDNSMNYILAAGYAVTNNLNNIDVYTWGGTSTPGDFDFDGDVDLNDFATFADCYAGGGVTTPPAGCSAQDFQAADVDADADVDLNDFSTFANAFTG